jgi:ABC transport system ATP-binding/permease protein
MQFLTVNNVSKRYGEKLLFENISFIINEGEKVALVAANGTGKSSLIRALAGIEPADSGTIDFAKNTRVDFLMQEPELNDNLTILENVLFANNPATQAILEYEKCMENAENQVALQNAMSKMDASGAWDYETRVKQILDKLKVGNLHKKVGLLSGGEKKRVALAKILVNAPDFLILDEPTNHLDLDMIEWLEEFLTQSKITLFMITHDRYFLENVCNKIIELENGLIFNYTGNYSQYIEKKQARHENEASNIDKARNLMRTELEWMRRMPKARGTKSKARIESFYELKKQASAQFQQKEVELEVNPERLGSKIVELHNISKSFQDKLLFNKFDYKFQRFDKVGIIGPNGSGKSTFIKVMTGELAPDSGKVVIGDTIKFGIYSQSGMQLKDGMKVIDVVREKGEFIPLKGGGKITAAQLLEKFLFPRFMHYVHVSKLSGGERRRLYLLTVLMENPNFLILDEPTNDLDILTLNVLEDFLIDFPGCLLIVSHDRYFMDKLVNHVFVFGNNGEIADFPGNYTQYRNSDTFGKTSEKESTNEVQKTEKPTEETGRKLSYEERKTLNRLEKEIEKLEAKKIELQQKMAEASADFELLAKLTKELSELNEKIDEKTMEWLELSELA